MTTAPPPQGQSKGSRNWLERHSGLKALGAVLGVVLGLPAALGATATLVYSLSPGLKPDPRDQRQASVAVFAVDRGVSFGYYLKLISQDERNAETRAVDPHLAGEVAYVQATVKGFKRQSVRLLWSAYDARTRALQKPLSQLQGSVRTEQTPADSFVRRIWVYPLPDTHKRYFVRVELVDKSGSMLAVADSRPFRGIRLHIHTSH